MESSAYTRRFQRDTAFFHEIESLAMTITQHSIRVLILVAGAAAVLGWVVKHSEPDRNVGLRHVRQAEQIEGGAWRDGLSKGIDHPLHPLGIVAAHQMVGGLGPGSWQRAALLVCFTSAVLLVIPIYLLAFELCGERGAWLAPVLVMVNPMVGSVVVNVLAESTLLLWWTFGLWAAVRFLREGRFLWLPLAVFFGALAYLTRPEGMLLPIALAATLLLLPLLRVNGINWPRWWRAVAFLACGFVFLVGPYIALKGGLGTQPGIARVLGLSPRAHARALEREEPLPPDQTTIETYRIATYRTLEVLGDAVTLPLLPFALLGIILLWRRSANVRAWLFLGIVLAASAVALARLHATAGYCSATHGLAPGIILIMVAALGLTWLLGKVAIPGSWLGVNCRRLEPGPVVWAVPIALLTIAPAFRSLGPATPGPFSVYYQIGDWLAENTSSREQVLDLTDWSLYFSRRHGYQFADVYAAPADPSTRWIVATQPQVDGPAHYSQVIRELIGGREPVVVVPPRASPHQLQVRIYDRQASAPQTAAVTTAGTEEARRR
jgi:hypothetical protein